jgi:hypothetical protein
VSEPVATRQPAPAHHVDPQRAGYSAPPGRVRSLQPIGRLQRTLGNRGMERLLRSGAIQAKVAVGPAHDEYEREADQIAAEVMRMPDPEVGLTARRTTLRVQRACSACEEDQREEQTAQRGTARLQRMCGACEEADAQEEDVVQAKRVSADPPDASPELTSYVDRARGGGEPLTGSTRARFENRFGHDFGGVRVHTDSRSAAAAAEINSYAFTIGSDIHFGAGRFQPGTPQGDRLLAHELTHTIQQTGGRLLTSTTETSGVTSGVRPNSGRERNISRSPSVQTSSGHRVMRTLALDSTVNICHRVLKSRNIKVSQGGLRVVLLLNPLDTQVPDCKNHTFWVSLTRSVDWGFDDEIATCETDTGRTGSFSFGNLSAGTYYLTIHRVFDHPYCCIDGDILVFDESIRGDSSGCVRDKDPSAMEIVHGALDLAGFVPVLGAIPDGINAAIYVVEGDWANAGLSAVAMVPAWGDGVKLGTIVGKSAIKMTNKAAIRLGEEGIAKGLKEVKAASRVEKATLEAGEEAAKATKAEKEIAEGATRTEKEAAEKAEKEAAEREAAEKEKKEKGEKKNCATLFPLALHCSRLPFTFKFSSPQAALTALKLSTGKKDLKLVNPSPSTGGPCPAIGMHYGVKDGSDYIASISCCPCCTDTPSGAKMVNRCRIV